MSAMKFVREMHVGAADAVRTEQQPACQPLVDVVLGIPSGRLRCLHEVMKLAVSLELRCSSLRRWSSRVLQPAYRRGSGSALCPSGQMRPSQTPNKLPYFELRTVFEGRRHRSDTRFYEE